MAHIWGLIQQNYAAFTAIYDWPTTHKVQYTVIQKALENIFMLGFHFYHLLFKVNVLHKIIKKYPI
jgi:hypothetical protein